MTKKSKLLMSSLEWTADDIDRCWKVIDGLGQAHGWKGYEPQLEIIGAEQMLDRYSSVGMPNLYNHWSFGKRRIEDEKAYYAGHTGLAYEMIINSNPAVCYLMEDNNACMQLLVLAHAAVGHSHFFKHNYLFKEWTDASSILDYLEYAKNYIRKCESIYGEGIVEQTLDHCHNLKHHGVFHYKRKTLSLDKETQRVKKLEEELQKDISILDDVKVIDKNVRLEKFKKDLLKHNKIDSAFESLTTNVVEKPEENLLYFLEKHSLWLAKWQREIVRIVRVIQQYFYPQIRTKVMNEGFASFVHYTLMTEMHEKGLINDGFYIEFLKSHSGVLYQPGANSKHYSGINPYTLGFYIFRDIRRIVESPTDEDHHWFPDIAGTKDWESVINNVVENYNDESFILQFLSPKVMRDLKLFSFDLDQQKDYAFVSTIHDDQDYIELRRSLSNQYRVSYYIPNIEIRAACKTMARILFLAHIDDGNFNRLSEDVNQTIESVAWLWGFGVNLLWVAADGDIIEHNIDYDEFNIYEYMQAMEWNNEMEFKTITYHMLYR